MTTYGLTDAGFVPKTLDVIRADFNARLQAKFGPSIAVDDESIEGQTIGMVSEQIAILWEGLEQVNDGQDPDKAVDAAQDALCAITGTLREPASFSVVTLTLTGDDATALGMPPVEATSPGVGGATFATTGTGTTALAPAWIALHTYALGAFVSNDGDGDGTPSIYVCVVAGVSAASVGPGGVLADVVDGTAHWRFVGDGLAYVQLLAAATETGPKAADSGSVTVIVTPVFGLLGVRNLIDATLGADLMSNERLRVLREAELANPGTGPIDAIRAALLEVGRGTTNPVTAATVFNNPTDATDGDGIPPHSFEALVQGGADQDIFDALLANAPAGIGVHGTVHGTSTDSQGTAQAMAFTRPTELAIYVTLTIVKDPAAYSLVGDQQCKDAVVLWGAAQKSGKNAVASAIAAQTIPRADGSDGVAGVLDASALISTAPGPTLPTTIQISARQIATYDRSRIVVNSSDGTP